jgi:hypothetical protein
MDSYSSTMIYDPMTNAIDSINVCSTALLCVGPRKEKILSKAIDDMIQSFHPSTGIKPSDEGFALYTKFLRYSNSSLEAIRRKNEFFPVDLEYFKSNKKDATDMLAAAKECRGTRKTHLVGQAEWELERITEVYNNALSREFTSVK